MPDNLDQMILMQTQAIANNFNQCTSGGVETVSDGDDDDALSEGGEFGHYFQ